jgi:hypothetical protein
MAIYNKKTIFSEPGNLLWRYRCDAEWLATAENEIDKEDGGRDTF